jgi:hypothetical protein
VGLIAARVDFERLASLPDRVVVTPRAAENNFEGMKKGS